jgi:Fe-S oxidoreductase
MTKPSSLSVWQANGEALSCNRRLDEQLDTIRRFGSSAATPILRSRLLYALGIPKPKASAENCIIFGCYRPFTDPFLVRDYLRVLDLLKVDYTYLDQEYCCGVPLRMQKPGPDRDAAVATSREFNLTNDSLARAKGATKLAYCCQGCANAARSVFPAELDSHVYMPDLIFDHLGDRKIGIAPMHIAYFEGCHTFAKSAYPAGMIDWSRYRKKLAEIEGLKISDLPNTRCCKNSAQELIDLAAQMKVDAVLSPCNGCASTLGAAVQGKVKMISLPELLLQILA